MPVGDLIEKPNANGKMLCYAYKEHAQGVSRSFTTGTSGERALTLKDGTDFEQLKVLALAASDIVVTTQSDLHKCFVFDVFSDSEIGQGFHDVDIVVI